MSCGVPEVGTAFIPQLPYSHALRYLGQYTHRVAISNHRLIKLADGIVTFRWRDSAHKNKKRLMALPVDEFLRRFLLHMLPPGFVRIRHLAFWRIAAAAPCSRSAFDYWPIQAGLQPKPDLQKKLVRRHGRFGLARNVAALWSSSNASPLSSFDCAPRQLPSHNQHETFFLITTAVPVRTAMPSVCLFFLPPDS